MTDGFDDDQLARLNHWIDTVQSWSDGLEIISDSVKQELERCKGITDKNEAVIAGVDLMFLRNKLEHMIKVWLGETSDDA